METQQDTKGIKTPTQMNHVFLLLYVYNWHRYTCNLDTFVAMSMDVLKHGCPSKPMPDTMTPTSKQPQGQPRKPVSDQSPASQPIGRPWKSPVFGTKLLN